VKAEAPARAERAILSWAPPRLANDHGGVHQATGQPRGPQHRSSETL